MADVKQIYDIVNLAASMSLGKSAIVAIDTSSFVSLGEQLEDLNKKDMFNNVLNDVLGRTVIASREYNSAEDDGMVMDGFTYGTILRKLYVDVPGAIENPAYEIGKEGFVAEYAPIYKPTIKQYLFSKAGTFEMGVSIPDDLYDSAFHSEQEMGILISAIMLALENRYTIAISDLKRLCRATYIANVLNLGGVRAVNLLSEYNTLTNESLTFAGALRNSEFLIWASMTISQYTERLADMSTLYNAAGNLRHTPRDLQVLTVLDNFDKAIRYNMRSGVYHEDLVTMPRYNTVNFWQGTGTSYDIADTSKVSIKIETTSGESDLTYSGVMAILYDIEAMGVTIDKPRSKSQYYPHEEFTNHWKKATKGYFCDLSENAVVFYMAET